MDMDIKMKIDFYDKVALLFYFEIVGFASMYYFLSEIIPSHNIWQMQLAVLVLACALSYISIRIIISIIKEFTKKKKETKKNI